jgi:CheY-like chemotaxis protein
VYGIVRQCNGHVEAQSAPGQGATFRLYFPRLGAEPAAGAEARMPATPRAEGETVLVVEDEQALREILVDILRTLGYEVVTASGGLAALELVQGSDKRIDLLVTDVVMPHMRGDELAFALSTIQPDLRVLFISGYPDEVTGRFGLDLSRAVLLQKPFRTPALAQKVRDALASPPYSTLR